MILERIVAECKKCIAISSNLNITWHVFFTLANQWYCHILICNWCPPNFALHRLIRKSDIERWKLPPKVRLIFTTLVWLFYVLNLHLYSNWNACEWKKFKSKAHFKFWIEIKMLHFKIWIKTRSTRVFSMRQWW